MVKRETRRDYCAGCGRWVGTWERVTSAGWGDFQARPMFYRFCTRGHAEIVCRRCWPAHEVVHSQGQPARADEEAEAFVRTARELNQ